MQITAWLIVLVTLLLVGFIRGRLLDMPLERDEGEYSYAGQLILQGIPPYKLAYNMKLPGTYYAYAAGMAVFGQTPTGVHLTLFLANALTIVFVFLLGESLCGAMAGAFAAASYGLLAVSPAVMGMAAHANHFVVLLAIPAAWLLWRFNGNGRLRLLFLSGLLFGLAFLMKQQAVSFGVFGLAFLAWTTWKKKTGIPAFLQRGLLFGCGMILPFCLLCLLMWRLGVFDKFWFWTFSYARTYATSMPVADGIVRLLLYGLTPVVVSAYSGFCPLAVAGLFLMRRDPALSDQKSFLCLFAVFSFLATATGFYFREHYFIQVLPALALYAGLSVPALQHWLEGRMSRGGARVLPVAFFAAVIAWNIFYQRNVFIQLQPKEVIRMIYPNEHFVETEQVARYIQQHSTTQDTVAVVGSEPEIYFDSQRHSGTGYIYTYALMEAHPYALTMQHEMADEIEQSRPKFLVDVGYDGSWVLLSDSHRDIFDWFARYAGLFYDRVGLVDLSTNGTRYLWDNDARNFHGDIGHYLAIYQRKGT